MGEIIGYLQNWYDTPAAGQITAAVFGLAVITVIIRGGRQFLLSRIQDVDARYRVRKAVTLLGYLAAVVLLLTIFSDKLSNVTVALGVAGAGIAFALQEVIGSIAGWLAITAGNFFSIGDRVQLGGIVGDVIDIGILRTTLMETGQWVKGDQYNGRIVRIANSFVFKEPVFNYSADFPFLWDEITIMVKYGCDMQQTREILQRAADDILGEYAASAEKTWSGMVRKYRIEEATVKPTITLLATDNWLEYTLRYVTDYKKRRSTKDLLFTRIIEDFDRTEGRVSIASTTVQLVDLPPISVRGIQNDGNFR